MTLSNKIRELRFKNGEITQKQLAERIGVSRQTMNTIENGRHAPTVDVAIRIADVFVITVDQLFDPDYEGKPARREKAKTVDVDRSVAVIAELEAAAEQTVDIEDDNDPEDEEADMKTRLANLRNVIG